MACRNLSAGRRESCRDQVGGLKAIYFIDQGDTDYLSQYTFSTDPATEGQITGMGSNDITLYRYELKSFNSSFEQSNEVSRENGTSFFTQTATVVLKSQDTLTQKNLLAMSKTSPQAIIQDQNDNYFYLGLRNNLDVSVAISTGTALGDLNGYTLTITGVEPEMANFVDPTIINDNIHSNVVIG